MEKRRSSLRNPNANDLQKMLNNQNKHLNFDLHTIKENEEEVKKEDKEKKFEEMRRQSLKNEFKIAREML